MCAELRIETILIVEDEPIVRMTLAKLLADTGFNVLTAADGEEGIRAGSESSVDVLVTDLIMPRKSGWETIQTLRTATPGLPAIVMTALPEERTADACDGASGCYTRYVQKPVLFDDLLGIIREALSSSEAIPS